MGQSPSRDGAAIADGALVIEMRKVQSAYGWAGKWNVPALLAEQVTLVRDTETHRLSLSQNPVTSPGLSWQVGEAGCRAIAPKLRPGRFRKGQGVFKQGDTCELIFVNRGSISVDDRTLIPGDYYGAVGVLLSEARMTEARAEEDAEVLFLSGADIFELVNSGHFELSHSLLFADAGNLGGSERLQRARGVARLLTGGDVHPGAIHEKRPRTPATQTEDGRRRIVAWEASFVAEADDDERLRLARTLPVGSALRGLMKTLRKAEVTVSDPVSVATQYSRVPVKTVRALLKAPWLRETPKYAVAEVLTRSRMRSYPRGARVLEPRGEIAHVFLVSRGTLRATLAHRRGAERCARPLPVPSLPFAPPLPTVAQPCLLPPLSLATHCAPTRRGCVSCRAVVCSSAKTFSAAPASGPRPEA